MKRCTLFIILLLAFLSSTAQAQDSSLKIAVNIPDKFICSVNKKIRLMNTQLIKISIKYLSRFQKYDSKLRKKLNQLNNIDVAKLSVGANIFSDIKRSIKCNVTDTNKVITNEYNSYIDSIGTMFSFVQQMNNLNEKITQPIARLKKLRSRLLQSQQIQELADQRINHLKGFLSKTGRIPARLKNEYSKLDRNGFYYRDQITGYKEKLKDPRKIEKEIMIRLKKLPAFQQFMKKNSQLALLFQIPEDNNIGPPLEDLQTRLSVQSLVQQNISQGGSNGAGQIQQNLGVAHSEMKKLKDKINDFGAGSSQIGVPDFKPNNQKTKTFLKRLEYSSDIQFDRINYLSPMTTNIGLGVGYKLNDKSIIGLGISYKVSIGKITHISITNQGFGLRSYFDWKIKKQLFISGGFEMNYNSFFRNVVQLRDNSSWQQSSLVGMSKKYGVSKKVKGVMKLLYDFLSNTHFPVSQALVFRLGYSL